MFTALMAVALIFAAQEWFACVFGVLLWMAALYLLRLMAKNDPQLRTFTCATAATKRFTRPARPRSNPSKANR